MALKKFLLFGNVSTYEVRINICDWAFWYTILRSDIPSLYLSIYDIYCMHSIRQL